MPLKSLLVKAESLMAICNELTKRQCDDYIDIQCVCGHGAFTVSVRKDGPEHHIFRVTLTDGAVGTGVRYEAVHDSDTRLDVVPVTLAEFTRVSDRLGRLTARLLQSNMVADGETNHGPQLRGYIMGRALAGMSV